MIEAVLWDFGGVLTTSPFEAFARYEREHGYPEGFIRSINATNPHDNAWARLERSEVSLDEFDRLFEQEATAAGRALPGRDVLPLLAGDLRPAMVRALELCAARFKTACLTNNIAVGEGPGMAREDGAARRIAEVMQLFDYVLESSVVGVRKPDPRFYQRALEALDVAADRCVYLDDLGINLKPAREMGMATIKVVDPEVALNELEAAVGIPLSNGVRA
jgi:putative hydrolase of the HAD superfamily